jgi:glutamate dehydrogenase (NAD(P)+)
MAPDVSSEEAFRLARAMTYKNASAGLPHGGGKAVIFGDPWMSEPEKERLIRAFARTIKVEKQFIAGPDMGTCELSMSWIFDEIGRAVALPREIGGIPLDEIGATGFGLSHAVDVALDFVDFKLEGARVVIQGFGSVGKHAARFLAQKGAVLVGAADSRGAMFNQEGLNVHHLMELKAQRKSVVDYPDGESCDRERVIDIECEIWIPAARPDVINEENVSRLKTRLVVQGANIPVTPGAEKVLHEQGILSIPDFIANAGGVICAAVEYHGGTQSTAFQTIEEKIRTNTLEVLEEARKNQILPRQAALNLAKRRIEKAMTYRRWGLVGA